MNMRIITIAIQTELDVVAARQRARQIAGLCGFGNQDQVRIATSVSELARNVYSYAGNGEVHFMIEGETTPQLLTMHIIDQGPGIPHLDLIFAGRYQSLTGMGKGLAGARRLMDRFDIQTGADVGTKIVLQKIFPKDAPLITPQNCVAHFSSLAETPLMSPDSATSEILQQNQELLATLAELKSRQEDLINITRELEDTNRGVVALYAELDEKAHHLRRADEMKSRFLSNMSHEFRTPLSSIRALAKLLLDRVDGELSVEQEKQVSFILKGATGLTDLVNDLLDVAKIEAGKVDVRPHDFDVGEMFSALRGMLRPLSVSGAVSLNFIEPEVPINLYTDEAKLAQILRNFVSNALKFTETGAITVSARLLPDQQQVQFSVADTGLGIPQEHLGLIFEEFSQLENPLQRNVKGTGLGLPLCRNLARLLHGDVALESEVGVGSIFSVTIPRYFLLKNAPELSVESSSNDARATVLVVEDDAHIRLQYQKFLENTEFRMIAARSLSEAMELWAIADPAAVVLDIMLYGESTWQWLAELKSDSLRGNVPVIVATEVEDERKGLSLGADAYYIKPLTKEQLIAALHALVNHPASDPQSTRAPRLGTNSL